ncbi:GNAT family N-acetyltransferase [Chloroflexota bacterium]
MIIKRATIADAEDILALQKLAYISEAEIYDDFTIPPLVQTLEETRGDFEKQVFLKAIFNGRIIGSVRAFSDEETCKIGRLIVHPDFQNQGIGAALMNELENMFSSSKRFGLFTGHKSQRNIYLYQKLGYKIFKTEEVNNKINLVYLEKTSDHTEPNGGVDI